MEAVAAAAKAIRLTMLPMPMAASAAQWVAVSALEVARSLLLPIGRKPLRCALQCPLCMLVLLPSPQSATQPLQRQRQLHLLPQPQLWKMYRRVARADERGLAR